MLQQSNLRSLSASPCGEDAKSAQSDKMQHASNRDPALLNAGYVPPRAVTGAVYHQFCGGARPTMPL